ncbi:MAG: response regulator transcription factor [Planctomycetes bacterium]|nr:response regulator transcription factor [Planctomycetota bacterium]
MTRSPRLLLLEDELPIRRGLQEHLTREGFRLDAVDTIAAAIAALQQPADLCILDRRVPDGDGLQVLTWLRQRGDRTPVIVLTARSQIDDRVHGLQSGADDYVVKPFDLRELVARIRAVLARAATAEPSPPPLVAFGDCELDLQARALRRRGRLVELPRMEFELLQYLVLHHGRTISRQELLDRVWGYDRFPTTRTIDYHVLALRKKCERDPATPRHLHTVHGVGYRFDRGMD